LAIIFSIGLAHDSSSLMDIDTESIELCDADTDKETEQKEYEPNFTSTLTNTEVENLTLNNQLISFAILAECKYRKIPTPPPDSYRA